MGINLKSFKNKQQNFGRMANNAARRVQDMRPLQNPGGKFQDNRENNRMGGTFGQKDEKKNQPKKNEDDPLFNDDPFFNDDFNNGGYRDYGDEFPLQQAQKPESFFYFLLDNKYRDLEMSIRGVKDVWDPSLKKFITKRKAVHCFTDEEAEEILRTVQVHLATDIKLSNIRMEAFPLMIDAIYSQLSLLFYSIADYRYGRYGDKETQYEMKLQNQKIFLEVMTRIQANYSMAVGGKENQSIHGSVKGQESLQSGERDITGKKWSY